MMEDPAGADRRAWLDLVFGRPVEDRHWSDGEDAPDQDLEPARTAELLAWAFEHPLEALGRYGDAQLDAGFWYLLSTATSGHMDFLADDELPLELRLRVLRSFVPLFEGLMATRCAGLLECAGEHEPGTLDSACGMWWDLLPLGPAEQPGPDRQRLELAALEVLGRILDLDHDACRASALHGLGHWHAGYPRQVEARIDRFLEQQPDLRPELAEYARAARTGQVL